MWLSLAGFNQFASFIDGLNMDFGHIMRVACKWVIAKDHQIGVCTNF
jgi:hypothetical protein